MKLFTKIKNYFFSQPEPEIETHPVVEALNNLLVVSLEIPLVAPVEAAPIAQPEPAPDVEPDSHSLDSAKYIAVGVVQHIPDEPEEYDPDGLERESLEELWEKEDWENYDPEEDFVDDLLGFNEEEPPAINFVLAKDLTVKVQKKPKKKKKKAVKKKKPIKKPKKKKK